MRNQHEKEMEDLRKKMESEKQSKAKMQTEIEAMKEQYEAKLKDLEDRAKTASNSRATPMPPQAVSISGK